VHRIKNTHGKSALTPGSPAVQQSHTSPVGQQRADEVPAHELRPADDEDVLTRKRHARVQGFHRRDSASGGG
jgi:hypothetical protein